MIGRGGAYFRKIGQESIKRQEGLLVHGMGRCDSQCCEMKEMPCEGEGKKGQKDVKSMKGRA